MEETQLQPLPFSKAKQEALVGHLLTDQRFFTVARQLIPPSILLDPLLSRAWAAALSFAAAWGRLPTDLELRESTDLQKMEAGGRTKVYAAIARARAATQSYGLEVLREELDDWLHGAIWRRGIEESSRLFNKGNFRAALTLTKKAFQDIESTSFQATPEVDFSDPIRFCAQQEVDVTRALTFGCTAMDRLLLPSGTAGGLLPGDMTVLLAPVNIGKTTAMITTAIANVVRGKSVLFLSHEGRSADLQEKMYRCCLRVDRPTFYALGQTEAGKKRLEFATRYLSRFLTYIPLHRPSLTVEDLEAEIMRAQERRIAKYGKGYDLIVDDYLAKLTTTTNAQGNLQRRQKDEYVYDYFSRLMSELDIHGLTAIQANREASRINRNEKGREHRLLTLEDVSESFGPCQAATNVITENRSPEDIASHRIVYWLGKSRSSETDWAVVCRSDYAKSVTHSDELGATWYRGTGTMSDKAEALLRDYRGQAVPDHVLYS